MTLRCGQKLIVGICLKLLQQNLITYSLLGFCLLKREQRALKGISLLYSWKTRAICTRVIKNISNVWLYHRLHLVVPSNNTSACIWLTLLHGNQFTSYMYIGHRTGCKAGAQKSHLIDKIYLCFSSELQRYEYLKLCPNLNIMFISERHTVK